MNILRKHLLCQKCLKKIRKFDADRQRVRRIKIKEIKSKVEKLKLKNRKHGKI